MGEELNQRIARLQTKGLLTFFIVAFKLTWNIFPALPFLLDGLCIAALFRETHFIFVLCATIWVAASFLLIQVVAERTKQNKRGRFYLVVFLWLLVIFAGPLWTLSLFFTNCFPQQGIYIRWGIPFLVSCIFLWRSKFVFLFR